jgi:hypothetical protein
MCQSDLTVRSSRTVTCRRCLLCAINAWPLRARLTLRGHSVGNACNQLASALELALGLQADYTGPWFSTQLMLSVAIGISSFLLFCFLRTRWEVVYMGRTKLKGEPSALLSNLELQHLAKPCREVTSTSIHAPAV